MVVVVYKKSEKNAFALECSLDTKVGTLLGQLIESNLLTIQSTIYVSISIVSSGVSKNWQIKASSNLLTFKVSLGKTTKSIKNNFHISVKRCLPMLANPFRSHLTDMSQINTTKDMASFCQYKLRTFYFRQSQKQKKLSKFSQMLHKNSCWSKQLKVFDRQ